MMDFYSNRQQQSILPLKHDPRQRSGRRSFYHRAGFKRERTLMTGTLESFRLIRVVHRAGKVSALLAVSDKVIFCLSYKNAGLRFGIGKNFYATNRYFIGTVNSLLRKNRLFVEPGFGQYPEVADQHAETRQCEKLGKLPAADQPLVA